jgi:hypothetical protein
MLTDAELQILESLALPLPRHVRLQFIESVASALEAFPVHDVGLAHRLGREEQVRVLQHPRPSRPQLLNPKKIAAR